MWILCIHVDIMCTYGLNVYMPALLTPTFVICSVWGMTGLIFTIIEFSPFGYQFTADTYVALPQG